MGFLKSVRRATKHELRKRFSNRKHVVMFHFGRTGSSVLCDQLDQHPDVDWAKEVFETDQKVANPDWSDTQNPYHILQNLMNRGTTPTFGFEMKVFRGQHLQTSFGGCSVKEFVLRLEELGFQHFIVLKRENFLRQYVSAHIGESRSKWHFDAKEKVERTSMELPTSPASMNIFKAPLAEYLEEMDAVYEELENALSGRKQLWLTYENDIKDDPRGGYVKCCEFIGVGPKPTQVRLSKATAFPLTELLTNYEEVKQALVGTPYEWMLE